MLESNDILDRAIRVFLDSNSEELEITLDQPEQELRVSVRRRSLYQTSLTTGHSL